MALRLINTDKCQHECNCEQPYPADQLHQLIRRAYHYPGDEQVQRELKHAVQVLNLAAINVNSNEV